MNSFQIKLIALILMTIDHIGEFLFPQCDLLGYIGRLSAPLFLYILCWSIDYTRNRVRFLARVYAASVIMDIIWILLSIGGIHTDTYNSVFSIFFIVIAVVMILENKTLSKISKICIILAWQAAAWILVFVVMQDIIANAEYETICLIMHSLGIVTYSEGGWFWLILGVIIYYCKNDNKKLIIGYTGVCVQTGMCSIGCISENTIFSGISYRWNHIHNCKCNILFLLWSRISDGTDCTAQCVSGGLSMDDDIFIAYNAFVQ